MNRRPITLITLILAALIALSGSAFADGTAPESEPVVPPTAEELTAVKNSLERTELPSLADFNGLTLNGETVTEALFADHRITMINVWGTFCNPCIAEMPDLARLNDAYEDGQVQVVGLISDMLNTDGSLHPDAVDYARAIVEFTGADYPHLLPSEDLIYAVLMYTYSFPETIFVDSQGNILTPETRYIGARSYESWKGIVDGLLASLPEE